MSTPALTRLPLNRMFLASLMSAVVTRGPNISLASISGTVYVVGLKVGELRNVVPLRAGVFQIACVLLRVSVAVISGPGSDWNTRLTSTSAFGIVYAADPRTVVWNGPSDRHPARSSSRGRPVRGFSAFAG